MAFGILSSSIVGSFVPFLAAGGRFLSDQRWLLPHGRRSLVLTNYRGFVNMIVLYSNISFTYVLKSDTYQNTDSLSILWLFKKNTLLVVLIIDINWESDSRAENNTQLMSKERRRYSTIKQIEKIYNFIIYYLCQKYPPLSSLFITTTIWHHDTHYPSFSLSFSEKKPYAVVY